MISYFKNLRFNKLKAKNYKLNTGMTYVELIVVLSIFATMSSIILFNYGDFQAKVDIKNLASDIASQVVKAQRDSINGVKPIGSGSNWKPSYGVYFNSSPDPDTSDNNIPFNEKFINFIDSANNNSYQLLGENIIYITKNNYIEKIEACTPACTTATNPLSIVFKRPDSSAIFASLNGTVLTPTPDYIQITIKSPKGATATIRIYPSGRVQVD